MRVKREKLAFFEGFDLGAGAASGVDGFLVFLGSGVRGLLADHHWLPVLRDRSDS